jgi:hypothetical protein
MIDSFDIVGAGDNNAKQISQPELRPKTSFGANTEAPATLERDYHHQLQMILL